MWLFSAQHVNPKDLSRVAGRDVTFTSGNDHKRKICIGGLLEAARRLLGNFSVGIVDNGVPPNGGSISTW